MSAAERKEHEKLLDAIEASDGFKDAARLKEVLRYLFATPGQKGETIATHFRIQEATFRRRVEAIRLRLERYAKSEDGLRQDWRCDCPLNAYDLKFIRITKPTKRFWQAHIDSQRPVIVVCNELMFFQDFKENKIIRFTNVNPETDRKNVQLAELRNLHPKALQDNPKLEPIFLYLVSSEVEAADKLSEWFEENDGRKVERKISRKIGDEIFKTSPVLLGTTRTNRYVRKFLEESATDLHRFSYRFTTDFREIEILNLDRFPEERKRIDEYEKQERQSRKGIILSSRIEAEGLAFGVVWRMILPGTGGRGAVTMIGSDSTLVMRQIALALLDDDEVGRYLEKMQVPLSEYLPATFELLFAVMIEPRGIEFSAGLPELVGWRVYSQ